MKTITVAEAAKDFAKVLAQLEEEGEEIVLMRDSQPVARLVPEPKGQAAMEIFAGLEGALDDEAADALRAAVERVRNSPGNRLSVQRKPRVG
jgi:antitoxin (DNA-binding transcriptional repressor) of toxin-antitoxin stability system